MAIRSTNANRASKAYNPAAKPQGGVSAGDRADFGQGPPGRMTKQDQIGRRVEDYGMSPWYGKDGNPMPWSGPDGQQRGQRAPMFTPNAGDPRNAGYFKNQSTPEEIAADNAAAASRYRGQQDLLAGNDAYMAAKNAGDLKGQIAAMMALKQGMQQQRFVDQGGTPETWQNRYRNEDNWQRPGVAPSPGGGRTMPPPPAPPPGGRTMPQAVPPMQNPTPPGWPPQAAQSQGLPPSQNPMFEGYLGGGAGVPQGAGGFSGAGGMQRGQNLIATPEMMAQSDAMNQARLQAGVYGRDNITQWMQGYQPGQSKSGMGQSPMSGPAMSTGNPMGGMVDLSLRLGGGQVPPWARGQMPSGPAMSTGNPMGGSYGPSSDYVARPGTPVDPRTRAELQGGYGPSNDYVFRGDFSPISFGYSGGGYNPMMGGGGMGGMGFGGFGGFNPMLGGGMGMGYNPGAQFSPYRNMMMGGY